MGGGNLSLFLVAAVIIAAIPGRAASQAGSRKIATSCGRA
jgi:hypothetical protein